jgi:hypothetical protein
MSEPFKIVGNCVIAFSPLIKIEKPPSLPWQPDIVVFTASKADNKSSNRILIYAFHHNSRRGFTVRIHCAVFFMECLAPPAIVFGRWSRAVHLENLSIVLCLVVIYRIIFKRYSVIAIIALHHNPCPVKVSSLSLW